MQVGRSHLAGRPGSVHALHVAVCACMMHLLGLQNNIKIVVTVLVS